MAIDHLQLMTLHRKLYHARFQHCSDIEHWLNELAKVYAVLTDASSAVDHLKWAEAELEETTQALGYHSDKERDREIGIATAIRDRALRIVQGIEKTKGMESDSDAV